VGGDLVGKVEAGIPEDDPRNPATIADNVGDNVGDCAEDDPRNPATIADNVGDNVGDCAGMAADLFETYVVTIAATMVLGSILFGTVGSLALYPMSIAAACIVTSIIGTFFVKLGAGSSNVMGALYKGLIATGVLSAGAIYIVTMQTIGMGEIEGTGFSGMDLFICSVIGLVITGAIVVITGTNVIQGLAVSMEATAIPVLIIVFGIISTFAMAGLYGIAIAVTAMLGVAGMIVAKAVTKGYAIASAGLGALVLFAAYYKDVEYFAAKAEPGTFFYGLGELTFSLTDPYVIVGLFIGGMLPYLFGAWSMQSVGRAAAAIVEEVRRQFKADPGIMEGTS